MFPATRKEVATEVAGLCGRDKLIDRAKALKDAGQLKAALAIAEMALDADRSDPGAIELNAEILDTMAAAEQSFIARNFFVAAARDLRGRLTST
jgi:alkyl sulfatase BDS1-like metallo-beta-lactamase superfamily hydrolase